MKIANPSVLLLVTLLAQVVAAHADPLELRGVYRSGESCYFSVRDEKSGASAWLTLGDSFGDWRLHSYDASAQVLVLARGDRSQRVKLADAQVIESKPGEPLPRAIARAELARMAASAAHLVGHVMPKEEAIRLGLARPDRLLSELSDAEHAQLIKSLTENQQLVGAARALGYPVGYKPFRRDILPPELSANLTDADIAEANAQIAAALERGIVPFMRQIEAENRAARANSAAAAPKSTPERR